MGVESEAKILLITTPRIKRFVDEYEARGFREQKKAAIAAGYAESGAASAARKLLKENAWVIAEVARRKDEAEKRARSSAAADLDEIIEILTSIARTNYCDFLVRDEHGWRLKEFDTLTDTQQRQIKKIDKKGDLTLYDKMEAMRMLIDIYGKGNSNSDEGTGVVVLPAIKGDDDA